MGKRMKRRLSLLLATILIVSMFSAPLPLTYASNIPLSPPMLRSSADIIDLEDADTDLQNAAAASNGKWIYDGSSVITITQGPVTITGSTATRRIIVAADFDGEITLQDAKIKGEVSAFQTLDRAKVLLVLNGVNELKSEGWNRSALFLSRTTELTLQSGTGAAKLSASGHPFVSAINPNQGASITISGAHILLSGAEIDLSLGTINITGGTIENLKIHAELTTISGGNITGSSVITGAIKNEIGEQLYKNTLPLPSITTPTKVESLFIEYNGVPYPYSITDTYTDSAGNLTLYLPEKSSYPADITVTAGGQTTVSTCDVSSQIPLFPIEVDGFFQLSNTLSTLLSNADGKTIKLLGDVLVPSTIIFSVDTATLDLNGHSITAPALPFYTQAYSIVQINSGTLTIMDSNSGAKIQSPANTYPYLPESAGAPSITVRGGKLLLKGGSVISGRGYEGNLALGGPGILLTDGGVAEIAGGMVTGSYGYSEYNPGYEYAIIGKDNSSVLFADGEIAGYQLQDNAQFMELGGTLLAPKNKTLPRVISDTSTQYLVVFPSAANLFRKAVLSSASLIGEQANGGTFSWESPDQIITESTSMIRVFTPTDSRLSPVKQVIPVNVLPDTIVPSPGGPIFTSLVGQTNLTLNWPYATDTLTSQDALNYYVYQSLSNNITSAEDCDTNGTLLNLDGTLNINTLSVTGLTPDTTYYFNVVAEDEDGNRAAYSMLRASTAPVSPPTLSVTPAALSFGSVVTGQHDTKSVTVENSDLTDTIDYQISGSDAFSVNPGSGWSTSGGGILLVVFSPTEEGAHIATLTITNTAGDEISVGLSGNGHTHLYSDVWEHDADQHWHECACGEKIAIALHTEDSGTVTTAPTSTESGIRTYRCTVCERELRTEIIAAIGGNRSSHRNRPVVPSSENGFILLNTVKVPYKKTGSDLTSQISAQAFKQITENAAQYENGSKIVRLRYNTLPDSENLNTLTLDFDASQAKEDVPSTFFLEAPFGSLIFTTAQMRDWFDGKLGKYTITLTTSSLKVNITRDGKSVGWNKSTPMARIGVSTLSETIKDTATFIISDPNGQILPTSVYGKNMVYADIFKLGTYKVATALANEFSDVTSNAANSSIDFVTVRGLLFGTSETTFSPNVNITRSDFVMALCRLSSAEMSSNQASSFTDISDSESIPYIEWAYHNQIISGVGGGKFMPNSPITREQMTLVLSNYANTMNYKLPSVNPVLPYADNEKISDWAKDTVITMQKANIMTGKGNRHFDPKGSVTRAEAAIILHRLIEQVASTNF